MTHNRKRAGGSNGAESTIVSDFPEQKALESAGKRHSEDRQSVGKDEVSSSNLDSSSKKLPKSADFRSFCFVFPKIMRAKKWVRRDDPQLDPHGEMRGKVQRVPDRKFGFPARCFRAAGRPLHHLHYKTAHGFRRLILHLPSGVRIGVEGATPIWSGGKSMAQQRDEEILTMLIAEICGGMLIVIAPL